MSVMRDPSPDTVSNTRLCGGRMSPKPASSSRSWIGPSIAFIGSPSSQPMLSAGSGGSGCLFEWKAVGEQTGGIFSLFEALIRKGVEPPVHVHSLGDEFFYVLEGEITFKVGDEI